MNLNKQLEAEIINLITTLTTVSCLRLLYMLATTERLFIRVQQYSVLCLELWITILSPRHLLQTHSLITSLLSFVNQDTQNICST